MLAWLVTAIEAMELGCCLVSGIRNECGVTTRYSWSEDVTRQYAAPKRAGFGAYVRADSSWTERRHRDLPLEINGTSLHIFSKHQRQGDVTWQ